MSYQPSSLESHKREAFDAMRAYHESELSHKSDAIETLKTFLTTIIVVFGGILASVKSNLAPSLYIHILVVIIASITIGATWYIYYITRRKIIGDHEQFFRYKSAYIWGWNLLGLAAADNRSKPLFSIPEIEDAYSGIEREDVRGRNRPGYWLTIDILTALSAIVTTITISGAIIVVSALCWNDNKKQENSSIVIEKNGSSTVLKVKDTSQHGTYEIKATKVSD